MTPAELRIRETAETSAPWYIKQAEFDGTAIVLSGPSNHPGHIDRWPYMVGWGVDFWKPCDCCEHRHAWRGIFCAYRGDSLEEAEKAYALLEERLLAGTLK